MIKLKDEKDDTEILKGDDDETICKKLEKRFIEKGIIGVCMMELYGQLKLNQLKNKIDKEKTNAKHIKNA